MRPPRFSVVLPVQNRDEVVGRAVASVLAQTFGNLELLVIDLGSSDRTLDAVRAVADRRVTIVDTAVDAAADGAATESVYHRVLTDARGDWATVISADVEPDASWLARIGRLADSSEAAFVSCGGRQVDHRGDVSEFRPVGVGDGPAACLRAGAFATSTSRLLAASELIGVELDASCAHSAHPDPAGHFGRVALDLAVLEGAHVVHSPELLMSWHDQAPQAISAPSTPERSDDELALHLAMQGLDALARTPIPDEALLARYATSGAVAAVRLRKGRDARRLFRIAARARPEVRGNWTRLVAAHLGPLGQRKCATAPIA